jgi:hypothetical protein
MVQRFERSGNAKMIILVISDFDPDGEEICMSHIRSIRDDFGIENVMAKKVALTHEQVKEFGLTNYVQAKKPKGKKGEDPDPEAQNKYNRFVEKAGNDHAFELEAIPPATRARLLDEAIRSVMDIDAFNAEVEAEKQEAAKLQGLRVAIAPMLMDALRDFA